MGILKIELKRNLKVFSFWMLGLFLLSVYGMLEYIGIAKSGQGVEELMSAFPKIVMVIFGMGDMNVATLTGYYGVLFVYIFIMMALYAINLGYNTTAYEINEKTADFIYAKPQSRVSITIYKQLAGLIYIFLFAVISYASVLVGISINDINNDANKTIILFNIALFLVGIIYYSIGALMGSISPKKGSLAANLILLSSYLIGIIYDLIENNDLIRIFTPLKYYDLSLVIKNSELSMVYIVIAIVITVANLIVSNYLLKRKDID